MTPNFILKNFKYVVKELRNKYIYIASKYMKKKHENLSFTDTDKLLSVLSTCDNLGLEICNLSVQTGDSSLGKNEHYHQEAIRQLDIVLNKVGNSEDAIEKLNELTYEDCSKESEAEAAIFVDMIDSTQKLAEIGMDGVKEMVSIIDHIVRFVENWNKSYKNSQISISEIPGDGIKVVGSQQGVLALGHYMDMNSTEGFEQMRRVIGFNPSYQPNSGQTETDAWISSFNLVVNAVPNELNNGKSETPKARALFATNFSAPNIEAGMDLAKINTDKNSSETGVTYVVDANGKNIQKLDNNQNTDHNIANKTKYGLSEETQKWVNSYQESEASAKYNIQHDTVSAVGIVQADSPQNEPQAIWEVKQEILTMLLSLGITTDSEITVVSEGSKLAILVPGHNQLSINKNNSETSENKSLLHYISLGLTNLDIPQNVQAAFGVTQGLTVEPPYGGIVSISIHTISKTVAKLIELELEQAEPNRPIVALGDVVIPPFLETILIDGQRIVKGEKRPEDVINSVETFLKKIVAYMFNTKKLLLLQKHNLILRKLLETITNEYGTTRAQILARILSLLEQDTKSPSNPVSARRTAIQIALGNLTEKEDDRILLARASQAQAIRISDEVAKALGYNDQKELISKVQELEKMGLILYIQESGLFSVGPVVKEVLEAQSWEQEAEWETIVRNLNLENKSDIPPLKVYEQFLKQSTHIVELAWQATGQNDPSLATALMELRMREGLPLGFSASEISRLAAASFGTIKHKLEMYLILTYLYLSPASHEISTWINKISDQFTNPNIITEELFEQLLRWSIDTATLDVILNKNTANVTNVSLTRVQQQAIRLYGALKKFAREQRNQIIDGDTAEQNKSEIFVAYIDVLSESLGDISQDDLSKRIEILLSIFSEKHKELNNTRIHRGMQLGACRLVNRLVMNASKEMDKDESQVSEHDSTNDKVLEQAMAYFEKLLPYLDQDLATRYMGNLIPAAYRTYGDKHFKQFISRAVVYSLAGNRLQILNALNNFLYGMANSGILPTEKQIYDIKTALRGDHPFKEVQSEILRELHETLEAISEQLGNS